MINRCEHVQSLLRFISIRTQKFKVYGSLNTTHNQILYIKWNKNKRSSYPKKLDGNSLNWRFIDVTNWRKFQNRNRKIYANRMITQFIEYAFPLLLCLGFFFRVVWTLFLIRFRLIKNKIICGESLGLCV